MTPPIPLHEAQKRLLACAAPLGSHLLEPKSALGHYLAQEVQALRTQPPADLSAMDGYAVCGSGPWQQIGESRGGCAHAGIVRAGEAVRISTGAPMPTGADRVLIQENAKVEGKSITATTLPTPDEHIRRTGFDFYAGDTLLAKGRRIEPAQIALALSAGVSAVKVVKLPKLALIEGGDELVAKPSTTDPYAIPASNNAMIAAMTDGLTRSVTQIGPVADRLDALGNALLTAQNADVIVTSGGASVGDHDLIRPALEAFGAEIAFWRVAIKPGKPLLIARRGQQIILGLPGNPVSSFVTAYLFLLPLLRRLAGAAHPLPIQLTAKLGRALPAGNARRQFLRAIWDGSTVTPIAEQDSSALRALASANALIERPEGCTKAEAGTYVPMYMLKNGGLA